MKILFQMGLLLLLFVSPAVAQEPTQPARQIILRTYDWKNLKLQPELPNVEIISEDGISVLKIENTNDTPLDLSLLTITDSSVAKKANAVSCDLKYENVVGRFRTSNGDGDGFLLSYDSGSRIRYFDRNNIENNSDGNGGLGLFYSIPPEVFGGDERTNSSSYLINGTSNWKNCRLPVLLGPNEGLPTQLELRFHLPGKGTVYLRPIQLLGVAGSWWSPKQGAIMGGVVGIFGGTIGCFGGLLGCLAGFGKARKFVLTTTKIFIALGMLLTLTGIAAILFRQPFFVWYVFLLPGVLLTLIFSLNFPMIQRRYDDLEIRRMASIDALRG